MVTTTPAPKIFKFSNNGIYKNLAFPVPKVFKFSNDAPKVFKNSNNENNIKTIIDIPCTKSFYINLPNVKPIAIPLKNTEIITKVISIIPYFSYQQ